MSENSIAIDMGSMPSPDTPDSRSIAALSHQGVIGHPMPKPSVLQLLKAILFSSKFNVLLVFIPLGIVAEKLHWSPVTIFILNFIAIVPLAKRRWRNSVRVF